MKVAEFDFSLPDGLIAQAPLPERDKSRLLVINRKTGAFEDRAFRDVLNYLRAEDVLVLNDTRVIPARLRGVNQAAPGALEILLLRPYEQDLWEVLVKPGKRAKVGAEIWFSHELSCKIVDISSSGGRLARFQYTGDFEKILERVGETPLPPYIHQQISDPERYQTVYSKYTGSVAAPTAGFHFTHGLLSEIKALGPAVVFLTLHVGLATFRPVRAENVEDHVMHEEYYRVSAKAAQTINDRLRSGGRIIAVGTTTVRVLETVADSKGLIRPDSGWTDIFIYPGHTFRAVDAMITNFHLPKSSLLMLVSAFAGREVIRAAYEHAVVERYRFFSFGDAMLLV